MLTVLGVTILAVAVMSVSMLANRLRKPKMVILQWGKFSNSRLGIKGHKFWADEPDIVWYDDYKYWIRLKPNPGFNLPKLGYWSKAKGRNK